MSFRVHRRVAAIVLLVWALAGATWLARLDYAREISTDVLDLIPSDQREPELALVRELASEAEARTMLFVLTTDDDEPAVLEAAGRFARELAAESTFQQVIALGDQGWRDALGRALFEQRMELLFPTWLERNASANLARESGARLKAFLGKPEALAYQDAIPADPLLLLPDAIARLRDALPAGLATNSASMAHLVWAQLSVSPLSEEGQGPVFAAIERALARTRADFGTLSVAYTGVNRFAAKSRSRIEAEVTWLNLASLTAVLAVAAVFIRRVHRALHLLPVVGFAILGAWCAATLAFDHVHAVVFVLGALLTGVAIDYGFYLFMQPPASAGETYPEKVRRLAKPLLASCLTTVAGFALLLFSELPMIRQLGVYVGAGLISALAAAVLYFALLRETFLAARSNVAHSPWFTASAAPRTALTLAAVAAIGVGRVTWRDDIRELEVPDAGVLAEDARIRAEFGDGDRRAPYLTHGPTLESARESLAVFESWMRGRANTASLGILLPGRATREAAQRFVRDHPAFGDELRAALQAEGFEPDAFQPFFSAYAAYAAADAVAELDAIVRPLQSKLVGPLGLLLHDGENKSWIVSLVDRMPAESPPPETQTVPVSQLQSLNRLFGNYRTTAVRLSLAGLAIVGIGVLLTYGWRDGMRIFAIPSGACLAVFGVFGWIGVPLNLFHLLGAFLGVCLTHNYSIFAATSAYRDEPVPVSVRMSALTTAASFGVLACSSIPVVRALGLTVALIVVVALAMIEVRVLDGLGKRGRNG